MNDILSVDFKLRSKLEGNELLFYITESIDLINQYREILKIPKKVSFMGKQKDENNTDKDKIVDEYIKVASTYEYIKPREIENKMCISCNKKIKNEDYEDSITVCEFCSTEQGTNIINSSFTDSARIHVSTKYSYDRKTHFIECINQFQGKQNVKIPPLVFEKLHKKIDFHGIENKNTNDKTKRYEKVTKKILLSFLKELGYPKQYENINLIYSIVTGNKLDDIEYITEQILNDFDKISDTYDKLFSGIERKNFINTQYVLYQLLCKYNHPCRKEDFEGVKTMDRKFFHEEIIKKIFETLGWNYNSIL